MRKTAQFALGAPVRVEGDVVYRPGKYFEIDTVFTDMNGLKFSVSQAEAEAAVASFTPKPIGLKHEPQPIDGLLGNVEKLWIDGKNIMAEFAIPKWLHEGRDIKGNQIYPEGGELKISSEWDFERKIPGSAHLVFTPGVKDAVIKAAFSANPNAELDRLASIVAAEDAFPGIKVLFDRHDTPEGQRGLQEIHDATARRGAVCRKANAGAQFASRHEASALQAIHDLTAEHGATCSSGKDPYRSMAGFSAVEQETTLPAPPAQGANMSLVAKFNALIDMLKGTGVPADKLPAPATEDDLPKADPAATSELQAQFAAQNQEFAKFRTETLEREAREFVDLLQNAGKIAAYEKPTILARFSREIAADLALPTTVKFSAPDDKGALIEKAGSRFEAAKAEYALRPGSGLTAELVGSGRPVTEGDFKVLFAKHEETPEEKQKRLDAQVDAEREKYGLKKS